MYSYKISQTITLLASAIAKELTAEQTALLSAILVQLGDTLVTIAAANNICNSNEENN